MRIPDDLLRQASQRLGIMALIAASLWVLANLMDRLASGTLATGNYGGWADRISALSVVASISLFFYARRTTHSPDRVLDLGLAWLVLMSLAIGVVMHWGINPDLWGGESVISWIGPVILMFAAIVPTAPRKMLVAASLAALMDPLGMWAAQLALGNPVIHPTHAFVMHLGTFFMAGVAVIISHVVTRLGREVGRARELGSYLLGDLIGEGGMGQVYHATHRLLARPAAIKLIRPEALEGGTGQSAPTAARRFRREAEVAASLRSPHTVELYDFGITEDRTYYFVMELLDGLDLEHLVRKFGPVPADRVLYILRQVCESLSEAHSRGLVHRDIKPANIHLGRLGLEHDFVKVLDFGLVKSAAGSTGEHSLTGVGMTPGTPAYMAPEAALGEEVDRRADLYSLGCVAYYLLTGKLVFEGSSPIHVISRHLQDQPVPPSQRTELPIPPELERLVLNCLGKNPADRPQHAADLARGLTEVSVAESWTQERAALWWDANRPSAEAM